MTRRLRIVVFAGIGLVVVAVVIGALLAARTSLRVTNEGRSALSEAGKATNVAYWVPLSAPLEELDAEGSTESQCGTQLSAWLSEHGSLLPSPQAILLRSTSEEPLAVSFTADGRFSDPREGFILQCGAPSLPAGEPERGELEWAPLLLRLDEDAQGRLHALTPTTDGPVPATVTVKGPRPVGLGALIQGDYAFDGTIRAHADGSPVSLPIDGAASDGTAIAWPGLPSRGTLRVVAGLENDGTTAFFCNVASSTQAGGVCLPRSDNEAMTIRHQAQQIRTDYLTVRDTVADAFRAPRPAPETESRTAFVRLDPWNDPALQADEADEQFEGWCGQSAFRADRVECETGADCFLSQDANTAACGDPSTNTWTPYRILAPVQPAIDDGSEPTLSPVGLRLVNGAWCTFHSGGPDVAVEGWGGSAGECVEPGGVAYPFWSTYPSGPLGQPYLFELGGSGYLRIAVREGTPDEPDYEDVAQIFY